LTRHLSGAWLTKIQSIISIREILERQPVKLPESLWTLLRSCSPIRTPKEEQIECFKNAEVCPLPETSYARTIHRAFMACITVLLRGKTVEVQFVRAKRSATQALYDSHCRVLKVAHQWLDCRFVRTSLLPRSSVIKIGRAIIFLQSHRLP
jgi:hypothetical protein